MHNPSLRHLAEAYSERISVDPNLIQYLDGIELMMNFKPAPVGNPIAAKGWNDARYEYERGLRGETPHPMPPGSWQHKAYDLGQHIYAKCVRGIDAYINGQDKPTFGMYDRIGWLIAKNQYNMGVLSAEPKPQDPNSWAGKLYTKGQHAVLIYKMSLEGVDAKFFERIKTMLS